MLGAVFGTDFRSTLHQADVQSRCDKVFATYLTAARFPWTGLAAGFAPQPSDSQAGAQDLVAKAKGLVAKNVRKPHEVVTRGRSTGVLASWCEIDSGVNDERTESLRVIQTLPPSCGAAGSGGRLLIRRYSDGVCPVTRRKTAVMYSPCS